MNNRRRECSCARIFSVDRRTGAEGWTTLVEDDPYAMLTGSPTIAGTTIYVSVSSRSELAAPAGRITFRGSITENYCYDPAKGESRRKARCSVAITG